MIRIGVDAMGGDYAPQAVVKGAIGAAAKVCAECRIVLYGDKERIGAVLAKEGVSETLFDIVHTTEVIGFDDNPAIAFGKKADSSITVGFNHLKEGKIDAFASAGNTGAMLVGSMLAVKAVPGVIRPTISSLAPTSKGGQVLLLDVGLNVDSKPEVLYQYGIIGSLFASYVMQVDSPRVAILNIGEESEKGNLATKAAYELMAATDRFNFVGNVEAKRIFTGEIADVVVCDGFTGNVVLKQAEGFYNILKSRGVEDSFVDALNYEVYGGTPVLGVNGTVMVGHGCSTPLAIENMVLQSEKMIQAEIISKIRDAFAS